MGTAKQKTALQAFRDRRGLTQEQAAALAGISQPHWSRLEHALEGASPRLARRLAQMTGRDISTFLNFGDNELVSA